MTPPTGKTVALVLPLWDGHHPMYFSQFTASFLRCGARVIALSPEPELARKDLTRNTNPETQAAMLDNVYFAKIPSAKRSIFGGHFEGDPVRTFSRWRNAANSLANAEAESGLRADLVYFPYLDSYLRFLPLPIVADVLLKRPWSGLYLRNHHHGESPSLKKSLRMLAKGDSILRGKNCRGIGVLDERFIPELEKLTQKEITAFPDVTQGERSSTPFPLALEIRRKAAGRKIIGMIGLERRKGILKLIRTAKLAGKKKLPYYFVCAGSIYMDQFSAQERSEIESITRDIASGTIDNLHFDPTAGRIHDERDFNSLFASFDIAWAAYEDFHGSSGTLSKAAVFEIPCLATAGECIGRRVEKYRLGLTLAETTSENALAAIHFLAELTDRDHRPLSPRYADYREDHSLARLDSLLGKLLATI